MNNKPYKLWLHIEHCAETAGSGIIECPQILEEFDTFPEANGLLNFVKSLVKLDQSDLEILFRALSDIDEISPESLIMERVFSEEIQRRLELRTKH